ncbi:hypothetical protein [Lyngbya sp. CCY1209]|uniref:hypothetical protein n=1 Tax=Lyngbya sp. CCY1209 TaxID=2886103 RepID=UPI002D20413A|nr:hypothetical protein [Lyngbya sp. CCY1209]MEB3881811.1 hypothetical protein [Lyngbya sp. CCY1209]
MSSNTDIKSPSPPPQIRRSPLPFRLSNRAIADLYQSGAIGLFSDPDRKRSQKF